MTLYSRIGSLGQLYVFTMLLVIFMALGGCGEKKETVYRIGILSEVEAFTVIADGFKAKMTELGYAEGKNINYDIQIGNIDPEQEKQVAKKFLQDKVDSIFAFPTEAAIAAKRHWII